MFKQYKTFYSMLVLILLSTAIVLLIYTYTINTSLHTVKENIKDNNLSNLRFVVNNLDHNVEQLSMLGIALDTDPMVALLSSIHLMDSYEQVKLMMDLTDKMNLQSFSRGWSNQVSIYSPILDKWIGPTTLYGKPPAQSGGDWALDAALGRFTAYRVHEGYTIRVMFPISNLIDMLNRAKLEENAPFFYHPSYPVISNRSSNTAHIDELLSTLTTVLPERTEGTEMIKVDGTDYMVNYLKSANLGWYMIDYVPLDQALRPIVKTQNFFYLACLMLTLGGVVTVLFLYRKVQIPIITLLRGVRLLKNGDFSYRIQKTSRNEFDILYLNFNDMAAQIEDLIEKVYKEKIVSREALVKQLQAQINPHFLYNCLFFINNMNRLGNDEAVTAMTKNLAEYFRYTTRLDEPLTTLEKEIGVVENYLTIQCLRMERLRYEIDIPDSMNRLPVPKLLIQPLVENSVVHGIEKKQNSGLVRVAGVEDNNGYRLIVEDDGKGLSEDEIQGLLQRIKQPLDESIGCALWNIGQRMHIHFQAPAGMDIEPSPRGGLRVTLHWHHKNTQEGCYV